MDLLAKLRGGAAEPCFKALAVARHRGVQPRIAVEYYVQYDHGGVRCDERQVFYRKCGCSAIVSCAS